MQRARHQARHMASLLKSRRSSSLLADEYIKNDELDSLITVHGVLCAFLLSVASTIEQQLSPHAMYRANFYGLLAKDQEFRQWIYDSLHNSASPAAQAALMNVNVSSAVTLDVTYELLEGIQSRFPQGVRHSINEFFGDAAIASIATLILDTNDESGNPIFPPWRLNTFVLQRPPEIETYITSDNGVRYASIASCLFFSGLMANIFIYLSMLLSPVTEDKEGNARRAWTMIGLPLVSFNYLALLTGVALMLIGNGYEKGLNTPFPLMMASTYGLSGTYTLLFLVLSLFFLILSVVAYRRSVRAANSSNTSIKSTSEPPKTMMPEPQMQIQM